MTHSPTCPQECWFWNTHRNTCEYESLIPGMHPCKVCPPEPELPRLDVYGWFICSLHQMLGHNKAAAAIGQPAGDRADCLICMYEENPTEHNRQAVINALHTPEA